MSYFKNPKTNRINYISSLLHDYDIDYNEKFLIKTEKNKYLLDKNEQKIFFHIKKTVNYVELTSNNKNIEYQLDIIFAKLLTGFYIIEKQIDPTVIKKSLGSFQIDIAIQNNDQITATFNFAEPFTTYNSKDEKTIHNKTIIDVYNMLEKNISEKIKEYSNID